MMHGIMNGGTSAMMCGIGVIGMLAVAVLVLLVAALVRGFTVGARRIMLGSVPHP